MSRIQLRPLVTTLIASAVGFVLASTATGGFAQLWPGRMVSLPVAILLGPWWGAVAAAIAALPTLGAGSVLAVCVIEALVVGFAGRRGVSPIVSGGLFWIINSLALTLVNASFGEHARPVMWPLAMQQ